jgi:hypothetical protein
MRREFVIAAVILLAAATMLCEGPPSVALRFGTTSLTTVTLPPSAKAAAQSTTYRPTCRRVT